MVVRFFRKTIIVTTLLLTCDVAQPAFIDTPVPSAAAMYIACDGLLAKKYLVATDAVTCLTGLQSEFVNTLLSNRQSGICPPRDLNTEAKAYAYVREYLKQVRDAGEAQIARQGWLLLAPEAFRNQWPCN